MPIYRITNDKAIRVPFLRDGFGNEFKLRDFFADNLEELLGVRFIGKEYQIDGWRIDTIGIDENGSPVIIEYKWKENEEILSQGLFYLDWLKRNKRHFELLVRNHFGNDATVCWDNPRVILVAQGFSRYVESAVQQVNHVELKTYALYENGLIHIENVYGGTGKRAGRPQNSTDVWMTSDQTLEIQTNSEPSLGLEEHLKMVQNEDLKELFESIRTKILELPSTEELVLKWGVTYRTTRSFVRFEFRREWIQVLVRDSSYPTIDTEGAVRDISSFGWGYGGKMKMGPESDPETVFRIVQASYNSTL